MPEYWQNLIPDRDELIDDRRRVEPITDTYLEQRAEEDRRRLPPPPEVQTRIMELDAAEASHRLEEWLAGADDVVAVPAPPGVLARERVRRDTRPAVDGHPSMRRQRIAVMAGETRSWVAYWSAPEPPTAEAQVPWHRALERITGGGGEPAPRSDGSAPRGGWTA